MSNQVDESQANAAIEDQDSVIEHDPLFALSPEGLGGAASAFGRTRLRTFITLRWIAIIGQASAVLFVAFILNFQLPLAACLGVIAASAWANVILMLFFPPQRLALQWEAALQFVFDILQVSVLVALTGGLSNPFVFMIVAPVAVASTTLKPAYSLSVMILAMTAAAVLHYISMPLPSPPGQVLSFSPVQELGMLIAIAISLAFFVLSALRVSQDEEKLVRALDAAQVVLAREQRLSALGALAAATAHELGTPLATIHLAAKEMAFDIGDDSPHREDVELIAEQAERCRTILRQLAQEREAGDILHAQLPFSALLQEAAAPHKGRGVSIFVSWEPEPNSDAPGLPILTRSPELLHALGAFIENAASFAASSVWVEGRWTRQSLAIIVRDDGPGFASDVLPKLGEPYVSERGEAQAGGGDMGLGFFIAKTLVERTGGRITPYNSDNPELGAVIHLSWPRSRLEAPASEMHSQANH